MLVERKQWENDVISIEKMNISEIEGCYQCDYISVKLASNGHIEDKR